MLALLDTKNNSTVLRSQDNGNIIHCDDPEVQTLWETCFIEGVTSINSNDAFQEVGPSDPNFTGALARQWLAYGYYLVGSPLVKITPSIQNNDDQKFDDEDKNNSKKPINSGKNSESTEQPDNSQLREGFTKDSRILRYKSLRNLIVKEN